MNFPYNVECAIAIKINHQDGNYLYIKDVRFFPESTHTNIEFEITNTSYTHYRDQDFNCCDVTIYDNINSPLNLRLFDSKSIRDLGKVSALELAIILGKEDHFNNILKCNGIDLNKQSSEKFSIPIILAAQYKRYNFLVELLKNGADLNDELFNQLLPHLSTETAYNILENHSNKIPSCSKITLAAYFGDIATLGELLKNPSLDLATKEHALKTAIENQQLFSAIEILHNTEINNQEIYQDFFSLISKKDSYWRINLDCAIKLLDRPYFISDKIIFNILNKNRTEANKSLLDAIIKKAKTLGWNDITIAAATGKELPEAMINSKEAINQLTHDGKAPIQFAIDRNNLKCVKSLITAGADLEPAGISLLAQAIKNNNTKLIKLLLDNNAPVNPRNVTPQSRAPLYIAVENADVQLMKELLQKGADPNLASNSGSKSIVELALDKKLDIKDLLAHGASVPGQFIAKKIPTISFANPRLHLSLFKGYDINLRLPDGQLLLEAIINNKKCFFPFNELDQEINLNAQTSEGISLYNFIRSKLSSMHDDDKKQFEDLIKNYSQKLHTTPVVPATGSVFSKIDSGSTRTELDRSQNSQTSCVSTNSVNTSKSDTNPRTVLVASAISGQSLDINSQKSTCVLKTENLSNHDVKLTMIKVGTCILGVITVAGVAALLITPSSILAIGALGASLLALAGKTAAGIVGINLTTSAATVLGGILSTSVIGALGFGLYKWIKNIYPHDSDNDSHATPTPSL